jgi:hypothetical protein
VYEVQYRLFWFWWLQSSMKVALILDNNVAYVRYLGASISEHTYAETALELAKNPYKKYYKGVKITKMLVDDTNVPFMVIYVCNKQFGDMKHTDQYLYSETEDGIMKLIDRRTAKRVIVKTVISE